MPATVYGKIAAGAALESLRRRPDTLPERELRRDGIAVDRRRLAAYDPRLRLPGRRHAAGAGCVRLLDRRRRAPLRAARRAQRQAARGGECQSLRFAGGVSGLIVRPPAESAISVASRRARVSGFLALITHQSAGLR
jgi:hypothetical protein